MTGKGPGKGVEVNPLGPSRYAPSCWNTDLQPMPIKYELNIYWSHEGEPHGRLMYAQAHAIVHAR